jgi:hypothetical protein
MSQKEQKTDPKKTTPPPQPAKGPTPQTAKPVGKPTPAPIKPTDKPGGGRPK